MIGRTIVLDQNMYEPRMNWRFCHELAHIILDHANARTVSKKDEIAADQLACDLLIPPEEYYPLRNSKLSQLKEHFPQASWEALARKYTSDKSVVLTIYDNGLVSSRSGPPRFNFPPIPTPPETDVVRRCYNERINCEASDDVNRLSISGYFIDEGRGVERVILLTELLD